MSDDGPPNQTGLAAAMSNSNWILFPTFSSSDVWASFRLKNRWGGVLSSFLSGKTHFLCSYFLVSESKQYMPNKTMFWVSLNGELKARVGEKSKIGIRRTNLIKHRKKQNFFGRNKLAFCLCFIASGSFSKTMKIADFHNLYSTSKI